MLSVGLGLYDIGLNVFHILSRDRSCTVLTLSVIQIHSMLKDIKYLWF